MKKNTRLLVFTALFMFVGFGNLKSQNTCPTWEWATQMQNSNNPGKILEATGDDHGNFYVVGMFTGSLTLGTTTISTPDTSFFVAKFDSNKVWAWSVKFELGLPYFGNPVSRGVITIKYHLSGKLAVRGPLFNSANFDTLSLLNIVPLNENLFVAQLNTSTLQWEWAQKAEGSFNNFGDLIYDSAGNVCFSGNALGYSTSGSLIFGADTLTVDTANMGFVAKLNPQGIWQWARKVHFFSNRPGHLTTYPNGDIVLASSFTGTINFANQQATAVNEDVFLATFSASGQPLNLQTVSGFNVSSVKHLAMDVQQNIYIAGDFIGKLVFGSDTLNARNAEGSFIAKLNNNGNWQWARSFGRTSYSFLSQAKTNSSGRTSLTGTFVVKVGFGIDTLKTDSYFSLYICVIDSAGNIEWAGAPRKTNGPSLSGMWPVNITEDLQGNIFIIGVSNYDAQFGLHHLAGPVTFAAKISYQHNIALQFDADTLHYFCGDSLEINVESNSAAQLYYQWTPSAGLNDTTKRNPTTGYAGAIKYRVRAHTSNGCTVNDSVTVIRDSSKWYGSGINLAASNPNNIFCFGNGLSVGAPNYYTSYLWSTGDTTNIILPTKPGTYILTAYDSSGCFSRDSITIHPLVAINTASPLLCPNDSVVLNVNATGLDSLRWFNGSNAAQQIVTQAGNYWVTAYKQNCYYTDTIKVVDFTDTANAQFNFTNMGLKEVQFNPVSIGIATGFWDFGDGNTASGINAQHSYANYGSYYVCYHVTDVCGYTAQVCDSITVAPVGLNEWNKSDGFSLYPNPSSGDLFLQADEPFTGTLNLYNSSGMLVYQKHLPRKRQWHLNLSHLPNGFYMAQIGNQRFRWVKD